MGKFAMLPPPNINPLTQCTPNQHWTTGHAIGQTYSRSSTDSRHDLVDQIEQQLHGTGLVVEDVVDGGVEVPQTIAGPLAKDRDHDHLCETPAATVGRDKWAIYVIAHGQ